MVNIIDQPPAEGALTGVPFDDRTLGGLYLPNFDNSAPIDLLRLRATIILLDSRLSGVIDEDAVRTIVAQAVATLVDTAPGALDTLNELAAALGDDPNFATTMTTALGLKAPKADPTFTGTVTVPTPLTGNNNTQAANTAWVRALLTAGATQGSAWTVPTAAVDDNDTSPASTAFVLAQAGTGALLRALTSATRFVTPKAMADAMDPVVLTGLSGTIAPNFANGFNLVYGLAGNVIVGQPSGMVGGLPVVAYFVQDATGGRTVSFSSTYHKFPGGNVPTLSTAPNAVDRLPGICRNRAGVMVVEWSGIEKDIR